MRQHLAQVRGPGAGELIDAGTLVVETERRQRLAARGSHKVDGRCQGSGQPTGLAGSMPKGATQTGCQPHPYPLPGTELRVVAHVHLCELDALGKRGHQLVQLLVHHLARPAPVCVTQNTKRSGAGSRLSLNRRHVAKLSIRVASGQPWAAGPGLGSRWHCQVARSSTRPQHTDTMPRQEAILIKRHVSSLQAG